MSLMWQIMDTPIATLASSVATGSTTVERPEGTYVFDEMSLVDGIGAGVVTVFDINGALTGTYYISNLTVPDDNRIDYDATVVTPEEQWTETTTLAGIDQAAGTALVLTSISAQNTRIRLVDFSGMSGEALRRRHRKAAWRAVHARLLSRIIAALETQWPQWSSVP